jgi:Protein kinase domain
MDPLQPGDPDRVGGYRLVGRLGGGGMGQVFLGRSAGGRPVAVKVVRSEYAADAGFRRRFALEVEAARRVGGFFTAQVVDADPDGERPWLVTAYVPGPSLLAAVEEHGPLPAAAVRVLGAGLAEGLAAVHRCGLVHRDLKPANVILAADGPRVIDFGIVRALEAATATATGVMAGTPAYMSPEQARGDRAIGPASDVFALGSVLVFAATGQAPFGAGHPTAVLYRIAREEPEISRVLGELRELVTACLAKDPAGRPSVDEVLRRCSRAGAAPGPGADATREWQPGEWLPPRIGAMVDAAEAAQEAAAPEAAPEAAHEAAHDAAQVKPAQEKPVQAKPAQDKSIQEKPANGDPARRALARLLPWRRRSPGTTRMNGGAPDAPPPAAAVERGWNGLPWGATVADFTARFPNGSQHNGDWWVTGLGPETFCGIVMATQYAFNAQGRLYLVAFYPEVTDRQRLAPAAVNEFGAPDGMGTTWTLGKVRVEVKVAGVVATLTHRGLAPR